jgi:MFS transporter, DHA3 family, macrolide efflux protein
MSYSEILRIRPFRDLWLGQAISQFGDAFYYVIFMFMVKKITGSNAMVGVVGALETLPFLLFGPYAGIMADRVCRRKIMLLSDLVSGGALALFAAWLFFDAEPPMFLLLGVPFLLSSVRVFFMPAKSAAIPNLVPREKVHTANAFSMMTQSAMPLIGLALSASVLGLVWAIFPRWFFFIAVSVNCLSFLLSAVYIARLPKIVPQNSGPAARPMEDFKEGVRYLKKRRDLRVMMVLLAGFRLMVAPFFVVYIAANELWFGGKPQTLAWFEFAFFVGMIIASSIVGKLTINRPGLSFCFGLATVGVAVALLGVSPFFWLFILWNIVAGLAVPLADIPINTYMQLSVEDAYRGRVNSVLQMVATGVMPIGVAAGGFLVEGVGVTGGFLIMGGGMVLACMIGVVDREFRSIRMPQIQQPAPEPVVAGSEVALQGAEA